MKIKYTLFLFFSKLETLLETIDVKKMAVIKNRKSLP